MNANANLRSKDGLAAQLLGVEAEWKIKELVQSVKDWQITHGSLLKVVSADEEKAVSTGARARGVPVSLVPTPWPRRLYEEAVGLQKDFNELYARLATNDAMLEQMLAPLVEGDEFTGTLWSIYEEAKRRGITQKLCLGIFRSDYMAEVSNGSQTLRQVEFNTFSCSGGTHANLVSDMHQYLHKTGAYGNAYGPAIMSPVSVPKNSNISGIIQALTTAHKAYCAEVLRKSTVSATPSSSA
jgi:glutathione synthase